MAASALGYTIIPPWLVATETEYNPVCGLLQRAEDNDYEQHHQQQADDAASDDDVS
jgi:hypothetical protein